MSGTEHRLHLPLLKLSFMLRYAQLCIISFIVSELWRLVLKVLEQISTETSVRVG